MKRLAFLKGPEQPAINFFMAAMEVVRQEKASEDMAFAPYATFVHVFQEDDDTYIQFEQNDEDLGTARTVKVYVAKKSMTKLNTFVLERSAYFKDNQTPMVEDESKSFDFNEVIDAVKYALAWLEEHDVANIDQPTTI